MGFFHRLANSHRRYNVINNLRVDNVMLSDTEALWENIVQFYSNMYCEPENWRPEVDGLFFSTITEIEATQLEFEDDGSIAGFGRKFLLLIKKRWVHCR